MNDWLKQNAMMLIVYAVGIIIAFTTLQARVSAVEADHSEIAVKIDKIESLVERIIVVEERALNNREDIIEIKSDVKDLKNHFNIQ